MQIHTFQTRFEAFECKFGPFEMDSKYSNGESNNSNQIQRFCMQILTIRKDF